MRYDAGEAFRPMWIRVNWRPRQPTAMRGLGAAAPGRGGQKKNPRGGCRRAQFVESHFAK